MSANDPKRTQATRRVGLSEEGAVEDVYVIGKDQRLQGVVGVVDLLRADTLETGRDLPLRRIGTTDMYYASLEPGAGARRPQRPRRWAGASRRRANADSVSVIAR